MPTRAASLRRRHVTSTAGRAGMWRRCALALLGTTVAAGACSRRGRRRRRRGATPRGVARPARPQRHRHSAFLLTEEQRARIHTDVSPPTFQPTIATTGTVAFNGDRSTPVLSQISGPVARILVNTGTHVRARDRSARSPRPTLPQAIAAYQKAQTALQNAARIATLDEQLFKTDAIARSDLDQARSDSASAAPIARPRSSKWWRWAWTRRRSTRSAKGRPCRRPPA